MAHLIQRGGNIFLIDSQAVGQPVPQHIENCLRHFELELLTADDKFVATRGDFNIQFFFNLRQIPVMLAEELWHKVVIIKL